MGTVPSLLHFGRFQLQPGQRKLLEDGRQVALGQRAFDVLLTLTERAGELVTKEELLDRVWPDVVVEENNLQVQVSTLRKVLGTSAIVTTAGRGYRFTLPTTPADAQAMPSARPRHNLPVPLTSFIGHEDDLEDFAGLLQRTRLLTLTGIGGCGKTRLAIELGHRVLPSFPDGVWHVDLAPVLDAERVPLTLATTLGIREEPDRPIVETLCDRIAAKRMLLVFDNCEQLVTACADLARRVIGVAPGINVLAATREGLGVTGERALTVRSLSFPPRGSNGDADALSGSEAMQLFVDRAQLADPSFSLPEDLSAIAEICRRLDGIPLAIELAAARVSVLSVDEIRARLDDRFRLLTGGSRNALGRQQTLLAAIQWSYAHLSPDQQTLLRRLSVFVGGWTLQGAVHVAGDGLDEYAAIDLLANLVDHSLVATQRMVDGTTRYIMLESVRQHARDRLNDAGEGEATCDRHLTFFVAHADEAERELSGPRKGVWCARLDAERENILAAHAWCDHARDGGELGLRLLAPLRVYFQSLGLLPLARRLVMEALARPGAQRRNLARYRAVSALSRINHSVGRDQEARNLAAECLAIARQIDQPLEIADALLGIGKAEFVLGNLPVARKQLEEVLVLVRKLGDRKLTSRTLNVLGELYRTQGELAHAMTAYEEALAISRERDAQDNVAVELTNLAVICIGAGRHDAARSMACEALAIIEQTVSKYTAAGVLDCATMLAAAYGQWPWVARLYGAAQALREHTDMNREAVDEATLAPFVASAREALGATAFAAEKAAGGALSYEAVIEETRVRWEQHRS